MAAKAHQIPALPRLTGTPGSKPKKGINVRVVTSVKLVKGMKHAAKPQEAADGNEKDQVERLKRCEVSMREFAKEIADRTRKMKYLMVSLYAWADAFGQVIGILSDLVSKAFDTFRMVLRAQIIPVCEDLDTAVRSCIVPTRRNLCSTLLPRCWRTRLDLPLLLIMQSCHLRAPGKPIPSSRLSHRLIMAP